MHLFYLHIERKNYELGVVRGNQDLEMTYLNNKDLAEQPAGTSFFELNYCRKYTGVKSRSWGIFPFVRRWVFDKLNWKIYY